MIGITILSLIIAYDIDPHRSKGQSFAYGGVVGLIGMLTLGYPLECIFSDDPANRLSVLLKELGENETGYSEVPPYVTLVGWFLITIGVYIWDRRKPSQ